MSSAIVLKIPVTIQFLNSALCSDSLILVSYCVFHHDFLRRSGQQTPYVFHHDFDCLAFLVKLIFVGARVLRPQSGQDCDQGNGDQCATHDRPVTR